MFGWPWWYNQQLRKYVVVFGTYFNDIQIAKQDQLGNNVKMVKVPIAYGPKEKFMAMLEANPDLSIETPSRQTAISLPRMSFEFLGMQYDASRKLTSTQVISVPDANTPGNYVTTYVPVPYNLQFQLNIMTRTYDDGPQILEQILPFFTPEWTNSINVLDNIDYPMDCPLSIVSVMNTDTYENDFQVRRALIWTIDFQMRVTFFGPQRSSATIRVATVNLNTPQITANNDPTATVYTYSIDDSENLFGFGALDEYTNTANIAVQPGLTANGQPTSNAAASIPVNQIAANSNYGYVVTVKESK